MDAHAGRRTRPRREHVDAGMCFFVCMRGSQHHALRHTELHFARCEVGHHDRVFADQVLGLVDTGNAAEHIAHAAFAHIQRQAQQLGTALYWLAVDDQRNAQIYFGKVVDRDSGSEVLAANLSVTSNKAPNIFSSTRCIKCA